MARSPEEPSSLPPAFEKSLASVLERADRVLAMPPASPAELVADGAAAIASIRRTIPALSASFEKAVRSFEASAERVEAHIRAKRRERIVSPGAGDASPKSPEARAAQIKALDAEIGDYEASLRRLRELAEKEAALGDEWERRAMLAVHAGDDSLARQALAHRKDHLRLSAAYAAEARTGEAVIAELATLANMLRA